MRIQVVLCFLLLFLPLFLQGRQQAESLQKRLEYEVSVSAQLIPVFAVDAQGSPVFDLKKEEIELYADGKPTGIIFFSSYQLEEKEKVKRRKDVKTPAAKSPERINFIIIDSLISNKNTVVPARAIAMGIINRASPGDAFVILESNQISGFQYVTGPGKNKVKLAEALKKMEKRYMRRRVWLMKGMPKADQYADPKEYAMAMAFFGIDNNRAQREKERYQKDIAMFAYSIKQLKYALKTIALPKTVFLISAGQMNGALGDNPVTYLRFLEDAAKAINYGGSVFYLINPLKQKKSTKGTQLKFMADYVGGKFVSGTSIRDIVSEIKKSTSAYYELAFYPDKKTGDKNRIQLKCKRKGVRLTTINYSERGKPYREMKPIEKKLFALNIVNGGSWSRMVGQVGKVDYKLMGDKNHPGQGQSNPLKKIEVAIPQTMRNRQLHLFLVDIDSNTGKAKIGFLKKKVGEKVKIQIKARQNQKQYFVIIEPSGPLCIYHRVM